MLKTGTRAKLEIDRRRLFRGGAAATLAATQLGFATGTTFVVDGGRSL